MAVEDGTSDLLTRLAGGERRRGQFLSDIVRGMAEAPGVPGTDLQTMRFALQGVVGQVQALEGRLAMTESLVRRLQAEREVGVAR